MIVRHPSQVSRRRVIGPYPFLTASRPIAFAHRGASHDQAENSVRAFAQAVDAGFQYLETDVRTSRDGVAVLFHDATLTRLTGDSAAIADLTWADLRQITHHGASLIPRLDEVLGDWPAQRFNLDVKVDSAVDPTLTAIQHVHTRDRVLIGSFDDNRLARIRRSTSPKLATSMGKREAGRLWAASRLGYGLWGFVPRAPAVQVPLTFKRRTVVDSRFIEYAHRLGIDVHVWTINDAQTMARLLDMGVDGIMTDRLDILADVYRSRGHWPPVP